MSHTIGRLCPVCDKPTVKQSWCREHYNEYMRGYMIQRYHQRRQEFIESRGGRCEQCGCTAEETKRLEIDHIDPLEKRVEVGRLLQTWSKARLSDELAKCQVLCHECHKAKTIDQWHLDRSERPPIVGIYRRKRAA